MINSTKAIVKARLRAYKRKKFPSVIQMQTTSACNARCTCCPYSKIQKNSPVNVMPDDLFKKIIDECSTHGIEKISMYLFNEPLLDRNIIERLKYAKLKNPGAQIRLSTNASLLTEKTAPAVADFTDFIYLSVQGGITSREKYEKAMGLNYDKTHKNILNFINMVRSGNHNLKISNVAINNAISFDSDSELAEEKEFWISLGISTLNFGVFSTWANQIESDSENYSSKIRGCSLKHRPLTHVHVVENGDVILCCRDWEREIVIGNLARSSISEIWNSAIYKELIKKIYFGKSAPADFICYRCEDAIRI